MSTPLRSQPPTAAAGSPGSRGSFSSGTAATGAADDEISLCESDEDYLSRREATNASPDRGSSRSGSGSGSGSRSRSGGGGDHDDTTTAEVQQSPGRKQQQQQQHHQNITVEMGTVETPAQSPAQLFGASASTPLRTFSEERMRRKLLFFFMNPIEKWQTRRRFPYKFLVQLIKLVLVSIQLCLFAHSRYNHVNYTWDNRVTFSHLFLRGWGAEQEVEAYPPAIGPLACYVKDDFFDTIDYAVAGYANISTAIGPYSYPTDDNRMAPLRLCLYRYKRGEIFGFNESYVFNPEIVRECLNITGNITAMGSQAYLAEHGVQVEFAALVRSTLQFALKTVNFKVAGPISPPDCYQFDIEILFDNTDHDGQMLLSLDAEPQRLHCQGDTHYITDAKIDDALRSILNSLVICICVVSFALCTRALYRAYLLRHQTMEFFRDTYAQELSWDGRMEFVNFWYVMIICNDVLLVLGSSVKEQIERSNFTANEWNNCSVLLGVGNLLVWFGVLRYLGFFKTYNVVILTLKRAAPKISRFLLCALLIYAGFTFCGWLVLGPYHMKFRSLSITSECLFALINGDDMFPTFAIMSTKSTMLWWFSRVYLYSFISLYIYVVLSLFISVIMDAYDTIKKYYKDGFPQNDLRVFMGPMDLEEFASGVFEDESESDSLADVWRRVFSCRWLRRVAGGNADGDSRGRADTSGPTGYTSLSEEKP